MSQHHESLQSLSGSFPRLSDSEKKRILAEFIASMTIAMREFYASDAVKAADLFRKWNELEHRVAGNLAAMLGGSQDRFPDDELMRMVEAAASDGLGQQISWAMARAVSDGIDQGKKAKARKPASAL